jgi:uncharacterized protein (TIGR03086 family)
VNQGRAVDESVGDVIGDDAKLAVRVASKESLASSRQPGAFEGDRSYPFVTFPAFGAAMLNLQEVVVHNWDVAKGLGLELSIDPAVGQMIYDWGNSITPEDFHERGAFGLEVMVPATASIVDRLVGLLGRQP